MKRTSGYSTRFGDDDNDKKKASEKAKAARCYITAIGVTILLFIIYYFGSSSSPPSSSIQTDKDEVNAPMVPLDKIDMTLLQSTQVRNINNNINNGNSIKNENGNGNEFGMNLNEQCPQIFIDTFDKRIHLANSGNEIDIHYIHSYPSACNIKDFTLLFLHGARFSSETWYKLETLNITAKYGYNTIAIDIPGFGKSPRFNGGKLTNDIFVEILTTLLSDKSINKNEKFMLIVASMSGHFAIPLLFEQNRQKLMPFDLMGMITIAPGGTDEFDDTQYQNDVKIPILAIYGEYDTGLGTQSIHDLSNAPNCQVVEIPKASHPAYLDDPQLFHSTMLQFCNKF